MSPTLLVSILYLMKKIQNNNFKLNKLVGLIFVNVEFWRPIRAEGRKNINQNSGEPKNGVKMTGTDIYEFTVTFGRPLNYYFAKNCRNVLGGAILAPPPTLFRVKNHFPQLSMPCE